MIGPAASGAVSVEASHLPSLPFTSTLELSRLEDIHLRMAQMDIRGWGVDQMARELNLHPVRIEQIQRAPLYISHMRALYNLKDNATDPLDLKSGFGLLKRKALNTVEHLIDHGNTHNIKLKAAQEVLDRELPKVNRSENIDTTLQLNSSDLVTALELLSKSKGVKVEDFTDVESVVSGLEEASCETPK